MIHIAFASGELSQDFFPEIHGCRIIVGMSNVKPHVCLLWLLSEAFGDVIFNGIHHDLLPLGGGSRLCEGIQLFSLNLEHRLYF